MNCVINLFMTLSWVRSLQANASSDVYEQYSEKMTNVQQHRCDNLKSRSNYTHLWERHDSMKPHPPNKLPNSSVLFLERKQ